MIADLKPYPAMKDSGVPWLGLVPEHWEVRKLRQVLKRITERNRPDLPLLSVAREKGVIQRDTDKAANHNFIPDDLSNYKVVRVGQFAMNKMKAWQGSYGVSQHAGIVSPAYFVFEVAGVDGEFFHAAIRSQTYVPFFAQASDGVRIGQWDLAEARMKEIPFCVPPAIEQAGIVRFLDHHDRKIRRYIRVKQRLIKLLEEQKQAIIQRAVTRGLDANVRLKPSGVEWLGDIPAHWDTKRAKYLFREVDRRSITGAEVLLSLRMHIGLVPHTKVSSIPIMSEALIGFKKVSPGQLVMNRMRAAIGMFGVVQQAGLVSPDYAVFDPGEVVDAAYFLRLFRTPAARTAFRMESKGLGTGSSGFMRLYTDRFGIIKFPVPPLVEQKAIAGRIDGELSGIEQSERVIQRQISLLRELRARLIADAVTGKLDVRETAAQLQDEAVEYEAFDETEALGDNGDAPDDLDDNMEGEDVAG